MLQSTNKVIYPSCSSENLQTYSFFKKRRHLDLRICLNCDLIFKNLKLSTQPLKVEKGDYYSAKKIGSHVNDRYIKHFTRRAKNHYKYISKYFDNNTEKSVLDIGSGAGIFLSYLESKGWEVKGIEPDPLMQDYAKHHLNLDVDRELFSEWVSGKSYGLIYLSHVLDDLPDLQDVLDKIYSNLKPGGLVFIEVPNHTWPFRLNFEKEEDIEMGNYFFSIKSLSNSIERNNFEILDIKTFHLVHMNTLYQKLISPLMIFLKLKPKSYRPYLRLIAKKI